MEVSYRFRLYPNKSQRDAIHRTFGCCRFVFNYYLSKRKEVFQSSGETFGFYACCKDLSKIKNEYPWLFDVDRKALESSLRNLDSAFQHFFRGVSLGKHIGYPKFKSKKNHHQSYTTKNDCRYNTIRIDGRYIRIPKIGLIKCQISKEVKGRILSATISKTKSEKYFVSLFCTDVEIEQLPPTGAAVGLDMGLKSFAITSDGIKYPNHKYTYKSQKKLARLQRQLSRKSKGSKNWEKARIRVAKAFDKVANQRNDTLHKLSTDLIRKYDLICLEDLAPQNMIRNHKIAKSINDVSWREFRRQLEYKASWYGKKIVAIDRFYPSSQICSNCGEKWVGTKDLSVRDWVCPFCGSSHDRDVNAAINILNEGIRLLA